MSKDAFPLRIQESERDIGEKKKGDLSELWVYTFRCLGQLYRKRPPPTVYAARCLSGSGGL